MREVHFVALPLAEPGPPPSPWGRTLGCGFLCLCPCLSITAEEPAEEEEEGGKMEGGERDSMVEPAEPDIKHK